MMATKTLGRPRPRSADSKSFTVGSLYAGIGGICRGFALAGAQILWANEWDKEACRTYSHNFSHKLYGHDIHALVPSDLRQVDILTSGFPCQAFSVAGNRLGFRDERGLHFFQTMKFLDVDDELKPKAFLFENVKNILTHDNGNTFKRIEKEVAERGYSFIRLVLNTMHYGNIPQTRERVYMIGFKGESGYRSGDGSRSDYFSRHLPKRKVLTKTIKDYLDKDVDEKYYYNRFKCHDQLRAQINKRNTVYQWRRVYVRENKSGVCPTLTANMGTGGHNVPLVLDHNGIRKLTPRECARLQGFKDKDLRFPIKSADAHLYKQIGNSVSVPVIQAIAKSMIAALSQVSAGKIVSSKSIAR